MTKPETEESNEHRFLIEDLERLLNRAQGAKALETKNEFATQAYPMLLAVVEHFGERMERLEGVVDEIIDGSESLIQPPLATQILTTLELGRVLAEACMSLNPTDANALNQVKQSAAAYLTACELTSESVEEVSVPGGEEDEDDEEYADGEDEEDEAEANGSLPAEVK